MRSEIRAAARFAAGGLLAASLFAIENPSGIQAQEPIPTPTSATTKDRTGKSLPIGGVVLAGLLLAGLGVATRRFVRV